MATVIAVAGAPQAAGAVPLGNLLGNPGAEEAGTAPWVRGGPFNLINYGTGSYPGTSVSEDINGGCAFFTGTTSVFGERSRGGSWGEKRAPKTQAAKATNNSTDLMARLIAGSKPYQSSQ